MQKVISVPNPDFTVPPVTSIAQTIINRRWIKFPINTSGKYSHQKNTTLPSTIYSDWGDNENIVDLTNTHLEFDFTGSWMDNTVVGTDFASPFLTPGFDQSSQALVNRLRIGTSQGMEIEQIQSYNKISNMIQGYTQTTTTKDFHLTNESRFRKSLYHERGQSEINGDALYEASDTGGPPHGVQKHMVLRLLHSSFFNRVKMLPLFLFRNGIRVELDFEDVNRAFVYETTHSSPMLNGSRLYPQYRLGRAYTVRPGSTFPSWVVLPGTISMDGTTQPPGTYIGGANDYVERENLATSIIYRNCFINDVQGLRIPNTIGTAGTASTGLRPFIPTTSPFAKFKNMLYLDVPITGDIVRAVNGAVSSREQDVSGYQKLAIGIPITIFEKGQMKFRGFIALPADQAAILIAYPAMSSHLATPQGLTIESYGIGSIFRMPETAANPPTNANHLSLAHDRVGTGAAGIGANLPVAGYSLKFPFPMYGWDHVYSPEASIPYKCFELQPEDSLPESVFQYAADLYNLRATIHIDTDNYFFFPTAVNLANGGDPDVVGLTAGLNWTPPDHFARDPRVLDLWAAPSKLSKFGQSILQWDYVVENIEWRMSLIKPSSDVFTQFTTAFQKDVGIPYPFTRIFQFSRTLVGALVGLQQVQIPISVRSLNSVIISLSDPLFTTYSSTSNQRLFIPMLSTFQRRGLSRLEFVTGGMVKPEYRLQLDPKQGVSQVPLLENFFGLDGMTSFNPNFHKMFLGLTRNLAATGNLGLTKENIKSSWSNNKSPPSTISGVDPSSQTLTYSDSSRFLWGLNLAKKDTQGFASGLDTSMSGTVNLNLYFAQDGAPVQAGETFDSGGAMNRQCQVDVICLADALFTAQNDANLIRW